jgi:hypothetical protein
LEPDELLKKLADIFDKMNIEYMVVGSKASIFYGEPRFTNDIDIVANIRLEQVKEFISHFPLEDFYISEDAMKQAIRDRMMFNIICPAAGIKVDIFIPKKDSLSKIELAKRKMLPLSKTVSAFCAAPEYVILKKMEYYREGGSEKHLRDISSMLKVSGDIINKQYITEWAEKMGVDEIWREILKKVKNRV